MLSRLQKNFEIAKSRAMFWAWSRDGNLTLTPAHLPGTRTRFPDPAGFVNSVQRPELQNQLVGTRLYESCIATIHRTRIIFGRLRRLERAGSRFCRRSRRAKSFGEYHGKHLIDMGVSGFKLDECDNSDFTRWMVLPGVQFVSFGCRRRANAQRLRPSLSDGHLGCSFANANQADLWSGPLQRRPGCSVSVRAL